METIDCILCDCRSTNPYATENGYTAVQCDGCGLVFVTPRPTLEEMKALYQGQETKIDLDAHLRARDQKTVLADKCLDLIARYQRSGRLLEVGSAAGYFLWAAKKRGFEVQGLDITRQFAEFSRDVLGVPTHEGTLLSAPFAASSFDIVYMRNVLSHLAYPLEEYRRVRELLRPGGYLIFETGNAAELPPELAGELELPDHLYHFSEATISSLLAKSGFEWQQTYRYLLVDRLPIVQRLLKRHGSGGGAGKPGPSAVRSPALDRLPKSRWLKRAESRINQFVRYDVGALLPGAGRRCTLIVVARRPLERG